MAGLIDEVAGTIGAGRGAPLWAIGGGLAYLGVTLLLLSLQWVLLGCSSDVSHRA